MFFGSTKKSKNKEKKIPEKIGELWNLEYPGVDLKKMNANCVFQLGLPYKFTIE